jgi:phage terminase large subunit-like protein
MSDQRIQGLRYDWHFWARPSQIAPDWPWRIWFLCAGRGYGKTRTGAEWIRDEVENTKEKLHIALIAKTPADARDVMIQGPAGILKIAPPWMRPDYKPSLRRLFWPNGCEATVYSSKEFDTLRGPAHHLFWADEIASWHYPKETWDNLMMGLRLGDNPRGVVTSTPRPIAIVKDLIGRKGKDVALTGGSTYENRANLPPAYFTEIISKYEGTTLGRQELYAELIADNPEALWNRELLDANRRLEAPELKRVAVAIDPPASSGKDAAEAGIIGGGIGKDTHGYLIEDASLEKATPNQWGTAAVTLYHKIKANFIIAEANNGGDMVEHVIKTFDTRIPVKLVHASRGKYTRAEPVAGLDEQHKIHHVGTFGKLEDQLCQWVPGDKSPDRLDARVWLFTELMLGDAPGEIKQVKLVGI